ncbi:MAG: hypothetical protein M1824_004792 [Vezdaea acicularis]|nr:MAG: hypothetical protein M1824_004792 [Vezdaea acicularis]
MHGQATSLRALHTFRGAILGPRVLPFSRHSSSGSATAYAIEAEPEDAILDAKLSKTPFYFETGYALFAKRPSRPFPPPFLSPPSGSFSDPLSTHHRSRDRRPHVNGEVIRGLTNGDDAVLAGENFIGANDGVGQWSSKPKGHAALWSRLILHFWALEAERALLNKTGEDASPDPTAYLQRAYEKTVDATAPPVSLQGTTTACGALLHFTDTKPNPRPLLYVTNLGDSKVLVVRPSQIEPIYRTAEQWHWFDCPRQLGTNSPDTPLANAVTDKFEIQENDVVLAMSDGVVDNLWEHEVVQNVIDSIKKWENGDGADSENKRAHGAGGGMHFVASEVMIAARDVATDPFAESPFMERAIDEGLAMEGGKLDDISVVAALCRRRKT